METGNVKYVMLPHIEPKEKEIKAQPWYRERMRAKYLKNNNKYTKNDSNTHKIIDPKQWVFLKDGLDDFRDGIPPPCDDILLKPNKGPAPTIKNDAKSWKFKEEAIPIARRLNSSQRFYSRKLPLSEAKKESIDQIINGLAEHPLALYPHLEETLPPDLFESLLDILDPEINEQAENNGENYEGGDESQSHTKMDSEENTNNNTNSSNNNSNNNEEAAAAKVSDAQFKRRNIREDLKRLEENLRKEQGESSDPHNAKNMKNTYRWLLRKEAIKAKAKGPEPEQIKAAAIDNHIKKVTEEYCEWVKSLGGEHNIDPVTLTSLFASGYDTKPALSVPIHVVELTNIPAELRPSAYVPPDPNKPGAEDKKSKNVFRDDQDSGNSGNHRYGAWYLPKKEWKYMPSDEKLVDPRITRESEKDESKKKSEEINMKLAPLHGASAFKDFIKNRQPGRTPKLIEELNDWQTEQQIKIAATLAAASNPKTQTQ